MLPNSEGTAMPERLNSLQKFLLFTEEKLFYPQTLTKLIYSGKLEVLGIALNLLQWEKR